MYNFKLTPLTLFLLILFVLVISIVLSHNLPLEGFKGKRGSPEGGVMPKKVKNAEKVLKKHKKHLPAISSETTQVVTGATDTVSGTNTSTITIPDTNSQVVGNIVSLPVTVKDKQLKRKVKLADKKTPSIKRSTPSKKKSKPSKKRSTPSKKRSTPSKKRSTPSKKRSRPSKKRSTPSKKRSTPSKVTKSLPVTTALPVKDSAISEYFKWYWYWKTTEAPLTQMPGQQMIGQQMPGQQTLANHNYSNNYMLKTQVVPPVCPSCPACPSNKNEICVNCGGKGGCGTLSMGGNTIINCSNNALTRGQEKNNKDGILSKTVKGTGNVLGSTVDATGNVLGKTVGAVGGLAGKTIDTVGGLAGKTIDTAGGLAGKTIDTAGGLLKTNPTQVQRQNATSQVQPGTAAGQTQQGVQSTQGGYSSYGGTQTTGADSYSYYGALPSKTGNFLPVTADFSSFRK